MTDGDRKLWSELRQLRLAGKEPPSLEFVVLLAVSLVLAGAVYAVTLPVAMRLLTERRERILRAVTRE